MTTSHALGAIRAVTCTAPDLGAIEEAYTRWLDYKVVQRGAVSPATAAAWGAPRAAGADILVLRPQSNEPTYLRFVAQPAVPDYRPNSSAGWNAIELIVTDPDGLADRLAGSPFTIVGPPATVDTYPYLRAMQARGPADEFLYFTRIHPPRPDLAVAKSFVDRCFIVTLGCPDLADALGFYRTTFGNAASDIRQVALGDINRAFSLSPDTKHPLAVIALAEGTKIEGDQYPGAAHARPPTGCGLPSGTALVTFECTDLAPHESRFIGPHHASALEPHVGRTTGVLRGAAGELIELVAAG